MDEHDPIEETPPQPAQKREVGIKGLGTIAAAALLAASKFKFLLLGLKFFAGSWTLILSGLVYAAAFGWRFGVVFVLGLAAHEFGHYFAYRAYGLPVSLPVFIPFLGAYTAGAIAPDLEQDAYIALAGPFSGLVLAALCLSLGLVGDDRFWFACAWISAGFNLLNMIPLLPFDGGRITGAIWPPLWVAGAIIFVGAAIYLHVPIVFVALIALLGLPAMIAVFRGAVDPRSATMTNEARTRVGLWYTTTVLGLITVVSQALAHLPSNIGGAL
jgi:Zn-dependent protease